MRRSPYKADLVVPNGATQAVVFTADCTRCGFDRSHQAWRTSGLSVTEMRHGWPDVKFSRMAHAISAERMERALNGMRAILKQSVELAVSEPGRVDQQLACVDDCKDMSCNQTAISPYIVTSRSDSPGMSKDS